MSRIALLVCIILIVLGIGMLISGLVGLHDKASSARDELKEARTELWGAKTELEKARGQVDHWKKAAFEREKAWKDVSEKLEQEAASAKRWREQSFDCLSEYSRATGKKDNSGTLRAIMGTVD